MESCNRYHSDHDTYLDAADHHLLVVHQATDRDTFPPRVSHDGNDLRWDVLTPCIDKTLYLLVEGID